MFVCSECGETNRERGFCPIDGNKLTTNSDDPFLGTVVGSYRIASLLGVGGMGRVYKAVNPTINSRVAIKVLNHDCAQRREWVERFFAEARAVNLIRHENIINILDLATLPDHRPYIVMEYLDGAPLSSVIKSGGGILPLGSFLRSMIEVLEGLAAAHEHSIVHRDLKPDNIFISPQGRAKVLDFGIAKLNVEDSGRSGPTQDGSLLGTPHYMSPEQAVGQSVDFRSDIYSMGVILFEGALGQTPFVGDSLYELLRQHVEMAPPNPRTLRPDLSQALETTILKALAKSADKRHQSARELAEELRTISGELAAHEWSPMQTFVDPDSQTRSSGGLSDLGSRPESGAPNSNEMPQISHTKSLPSSDTPALAGQASRGRRRGSLIGAAFLALLVGGGGVYLWQNREEPTVGQTGDSDSEVAEAGTEGIAVSIVDAQVSAGNSSDAKDVGDRESRTRLALDTDSERVANKQPSGTTGHSASQTTPPTTTTVPPKHSTSPTQTKKGQPPAQPSGSLIDDISHQISVTKNPSAFDIQGYRHKARQQARAVFPDAVLVRIDAYHVSPNGKANLTVDSQSSVLYRFQSKSRAKRPKGIPLGVDYKPNCLYYVKVDAKSVVAYGLKDWKCKMRYTGMPKCTPKEIWKRSIDKGAPAKNALATLSFWGSGQGNRWLFDIKGSEYSWFIPDNC